MDYGMYFLESHMEQVTDLTWRGSLVNLSMDLLDEITKLFTILLWLSEKLEFPMSCSETAGGGATQVMTRSSAARPATHSLFSFFPCFSL